MRSALNSRIISCALNGHTVNSPDVPVASSEAVLFTWPILLRARFVTRFDRSLACLLPYAYLLAAVTVAVASHHVVSRRSSATATAVVVRKSVAATVGSTRVLECDVRNPTTSKVYVEQIITWRKQGTEVSDHVNDDVAMTKTRRDKIRGMT